MTFFDAVCGPATPLVMTLPRISGLFPCVTGGYVPRALVIDSE